MAIDPSLERVVAPDRHTWRAWLEANHTTAPGVVLLYFKKASPKPSIVWSQAVDEALCFGWIDSKVAPIDDLQYEQYFTRRRPRSVWSQVNKAKVERLMSEGLMAPAGLEVVRLAQANGSWTSLDEGVADTLSADVQAAFDLNPRAQRTWDSFSPSFRRLMLEWIAQAKRPQTRAQRIAELAQEAAEGRKPVRFQIPAQPRSEQD